MASAFLDFADRRSADRGRKELAMQSGYESLRLFMRHGLAIAVVAGLGTAMAVLALVLQVSALAFWVGIAAGAGLLVAALLLILRDMVRVIIDTLVPAP
jgi:hypothetical protein